MVVVVAYQWPESGLSEPVAFVGPFMVCWWLLFEAFVWGSRMFTLSKILSELVALVAVGKLLLVELRAIRKLLGRRAPGLVFLKVVREEDGMLIFSLSLPEAADKDVREGGRRKLVVKVGEADSQSFDMPGDTTVTSELSGKDNDAVVGTLVDVDDAGNESPAREFSLVLTDTIAPAQPGEVGITVIREE